jgi:hypothetical protein
MSFSWKTSDSAETVAFPEMPIYSAKNKAEFLQIRCLLGNAVSKLVHDYMFVPSLHAKTDCNHGSSNLAGETFTDMRNFPGFLKYICTMK